MGADYVSSGGNGVAILCAEVEPRLTQGSLWCTNCLVLIAAAAAYNYKNVAAQIPLVDFCQE